MQNWLNSIAAFHKFVLGDIFQCVGHEITIRNEVDTGGMGLKSDEQRCKEIIIHTMHYGRKWANKTLPN